MGTNDATRPDHPVVRASVADPAMSFVNPERLPQILTSSVAASDPIVAVQPDP